MDVVAKEKGYEATSKEVTPKSCNFDLWICMIDKYLFNQVESERHEMERGRN